MATIAPSRQWARWLLIPALVALASAQIRPPKGRFMLYNSCQAVSATVALLPEGSPPSGVSLPQLETMVQRRIGTDGLYAAGARTHLRIGVSRYAVRLEFIKTVVDKASDDYATIATFSRSAAVADGQAATLILEVSKLLDVFLSNYRRVNLLDCGAMAAEDDPEPPKLRRTVAPPRPKSPSPATPEIRGRPIDIDRWWPVPETEQEDAEKVHRINDAVSPPRLRSKVEPAYSEKARQARVQGVVMLSVEIWPDGRPLNIRVVRSLGWGLDEEAVKAVRQWRFYPGTLEGNPVRVQAQIEVSFRLLEDPAERRTRR